MPIAKAARRRASAAEEALGRQRQGVNIRALQCSFIASEHAGVAEAALPILSWRWALVDHLALPALLDAGQICWGFRPMMFSRRHPTQLLWDRRITDVIAWPADDRAGWKSGQRPGRCFAVPAFENDGG
jgi:hypothetical protein